MATDIIIPLGHGSKSGDDELCLLLRSLEKNASNVGRVAVVSDSFPEWITGVEKIEHGDRYQHNKDANMIEKVMAAVDALRCANFVLCSDDNIFNAPCDLDNLPILYNARNQEAFGPDYRAGKWSRWHRRMYHTFWLAEQMGVELTHNYETHCPQRFSASIKDVISQINYTAGVGFGIYTTFRLCEGILGGEEQTPYKTTHEDVESAKNPMCRMFVGYNDNAFYSGLNERLFSNFPWKSKYER